MACKLKVLEPLRILSDGGSRSLYELYAALVTGPLILLHPQDLLQADGPRGGGQEKVLGHGRAPGSAIPRVYSDRAAAEAFCSLYVLICQQLIRKPRPWGMILRIPSCSGGG